MLHRGPQVATVFDCYGVMIADTNRACRTLWHHKGEHNLLCKSQEGRHLDSVAWDAPGQQQEVAVHPEQRAGLQFIVLLLSCSQTGPQLLQHASKTKMP